MTQTLYQGVSHAAWGYFFLYFDVNLGPLNVLTDWAAYLLFLSAIGKLRGEQRDFLLLRPLGIALAAWNGADWLLSWAGRSVDGLFLPLDLLIAVAGIYFHFQFLTDCAELASVHQPPEAGVDQRIRQWRTVQTVLLTLTTCLLYASEWLEVEPVLYAFAGASLIVGLCIMAAMFALRRLFREKAAE